MFIRHILVYQKLSETFIRNNLSSFSEDEIHTICRYQKLSETFVKNNFTAEKIGYDLEPIYRELLTYQKFSDNFVDKFKNKDYYLDVKKSWLYASAYLKKQQIMNYGTFECYDDYFIAYKSIRNDRYSLCNFQYKYEKGCIYESSCDCTNRADSFGLNVGTEKFAKEFGEIRPNSIIVRCKVRYEDVGTIVHYGEKIRCFKIEILD